MAIGHISAHLIGVGAHRVNEINEIISKRKLEGVNLSWEQAEAEFIEAHSRKGTDGIGQR